MKKCACRGSFLERFIQPSILLLLNEEPMHGFSILKKLYKSDVMDYSSIDPTGLYRTLKKMEESGLLTSRIETDGGLQEPEAETPAAQVLALVNAQRARAGLGSLSLDPEASKAAGVRAREIQISFSHTRPDGRDFSTALSEAGASFRASGENIAYGQRSAEQVMDVWMNSAGHRANILNPGYSRIGIGHVKDSRGVDHWVQLFLN